MDSSGNSAEYTRAADVLFVSKGGTNHLHGAAFYNYNGNALNANPNVFFNSTSVQLPSRSVNNDFGASIGGLSGATRRSSLAPSRVYRSINMRA